MRIHVSKEFSQSNGEYYNSLSSGWIFEYLLKVFYKWDPNDRTLKVETDWKSFGRLLLKPPYARARMWMREGIKIRDDAELAQLVRARDC